MRTLLILGSTALLLAGCAKPMDVAPRPALVAPDQFVFAPPATIDSGATDAHGLALIPADDQAFKALMIKAKNAPDLGIALARIEAARAVAARAAAERKPSVDATASTSVQRTNPNQFGTLPPGVSGDDTRFSIGGGVSARWDPDVFGRLKATAQSAARRVDAAGYDAEAVRLALTSEVAAAVLDWQAIAAQTERLTANIAAAQDRANLIRVRVRAGLNPALDAMRAEALAEGLRSQLPVLKGEEAAIIGRMVALTATAGDRVLADLKTASSLTAGGQAITSVPSALTANRPDIQAAAARLAASDADLVAAAAARYPRFNLSSALGLLSFSLGGIFNTDAITGSLGGDLVAPLLNFGRIDAEINQSKAQTQIAFEDLRKTMFTAFGETESALGRLSFAEQETALLMQQSAREREIARVTVSRYRAGLTSYIDVLDADRASYQAQLNAIIARAKTERARLSLWQSLGGPGRDKVWGSLF
jgi:outer membrane protein, multidrug efflux system